MGCFQSLQQDVVTPRDRRRDESSDQSHSHPDSTDEEEEEALSSSSSSRRCVSLNLAFANVHVKNEEFSWKSPGKMRIEALPPLNEDGKAVIPWIQLTWCDAANTESILHIYQFNKVEVSVSVSVIASPRQQNANNKAIDDVHDDNVEVDVVFEAREPKFIDISSMMPLLEYLHPEKQTLLELARCYDGPLLGYQEHSLMRKPLGHWEENQLSPFGFVHGSVALKVGAPVGLRLARLRHVKAKVPLNQGQSSSVAKKDDNKGRAKRPIHHAILRSIHLWPRC